MSFATTRSPNSEERRISPVFWVLLAILGTSGWAVWTGFGTVDFGVFLFVVAGWMVSLCLHEYAHARTALHGGDITVGAKGYLTLNPFRYANAVLSFVLPVVFVVLGGIGLPGGAVFIERHRIQGRLKHSLISAAGPLVNLLCAVVVLVPVGAGWLDSQAPEFQAALSFLGMLQVSAALLNLLPVPGLDGYGIVEPWLSPQTRRAVAPFAPYGMMAVFVVLWQSQVNVWFFNLVYDVMGFFGVSSSYAAVGSYLFRFWTH
ncbi:site-2 protease family protein [Kitasatospora sp. NBC_01287]|uniref:site-2 protease family protein n=1 Tax=Kitasatospora sp. NBC_01287 TaxID=2903573 RepID=UPI002250E06A|nr:site-2 protease family protein [Kitasatospora sp. NBC_01287]MCX4749446.1 site-2 protease family protein [Kitasatospora sp. NBC_01287]